MKNLTAKLIVLGIVLFAQRGFAFYDSSVGRWLTRDPLGESGIEVAISSAQHTKPKTVLAEITEDPNLYRFVRNNPIVYVDRHGREALHYGKDKNGEPTCDAPNIVPPVGPPDWHSCRNKHQKCPADEPKGDPNWKPDEHNWGNTDPMKGHVGNCYRGKKGGPILKQGGAQCCYVDGKLNESDPGTYDYIQPGGLLRDAGHGLCDWLPAKIWGN